MNQLLDVNEKHGYFTVQFWLYCFYFSHSAKWNVTQMGGHTFVVAPAGTFWSADIVSLDSTKRHYESYNQQIVYGDSGTVLYWTSMLTSDIACSFDITSFPFDKHNCHIRLGAWTSKPKDYRIVPFMMDDGLPLLYFTPNDAWEVGRPVRVTKEQRLGRDSIYYDMIVFHIRLERRHLFHLLMFLLPNVILYLLSGLIYFIPNESGEKISYAITILLAQFVSLGMIYDLLPASSLSFPRIGYFFELAIMHMSITTFFITLVVKFHFSNNPPSSKINKLLTNKRAMTLFFLTPYKFHDRTAINNDGPTTNSLTTVRKRERKTALSEVNNNNTIHSASVITETEILENDPQFWAHFAAYLNNLFLYVHILITAAVFAIPFLL